MDQAVNTGLSSCTSGFKPMAVHVGSVVDKVVLDTVFLFK
jgi:hypothetical protein